MIVYFGQDEQGHFADSEDGSRQYLSPELWHQFVQAGAHAGADTSMLPIKLSIIEQVTVEKFEGDQLVETVSL